MLHLLVLSAIFLLTDTQAHCLINMRSLIINTGCTCTCRHTVHMHVYMLHACVQSCVHVHVHILNTCMYMLHACDMYMLTDGSKMPLLLSVQLGHNLPLQVRGPAFIQPACTHTHRDRIKPPWPHPGMFASGKLEQLHFMPKTKLQDSKLLVLAHAKVTILFLL